ncbi:MAG TPA: metal-dependent hydrolase [Candidatus Babeliales bacterium]|nr:metal-dependent hydrolase [Candidatus Babeliales bacterium]
MKKHEKKNSTIMPGYKGHLAGGVIVFGILFFGVVVGFTKPSLMTACEWLLFTLAGSLFPDIDIKSKGQKYFYYIVFLFFIILTLRQRFEMLACCSFIILSPLLVRHRGIFHSPGFVIAAPMIFWIVISIFMPKISTQIFFDSVFFIVGALSHLWLDFGTRHMIRRLLTRRSKRW